MDKSEPAALELQELPAATAAVHTNGTHTNGTHTNGHTNGTHKKDDAVAIAHNDDDVEGDDDDNEDVSMMGDTLQQLLLKFEHVSHIVDVHSGPLWKSKTEEKIILDSVSGSARPGELLAIMGPSGSGKTSLLNVLAGRVKTVAGTVTLNNRPLPKSYHRILAYVMQDDLLPSTLTPRELFTFAANLRLVHLTPEERKQRVEFTIRVLGLRKATNTMVGDEVAIRGLSGGERKRTSIGYELITNPSIIFLDEPTSGLDAFTSYSLMLTLRKLARQGRTVITTIHQPSSEIFLKFDRLILLARGRMVYNGLAIDSMAYFDSIGYLVESFTNPADRYMEILHTQTDEDMDRIKKIADAYRSNEPAILAKETAETDKLHMEIVEKPAKRPNLLTEFGLLTRRAFLMITRNPLTLRARIGQTVIIALISGAVFAKLDVNQTSIQGRNGSLFFALMGQAMNALMSGVLTMPLERRLLVREQNSGMYRISSYYIGKSVVSSVANIFITTLYCLIFYWLVGFSNTPSQFFIFYALLNLVMFTGDSLGLMLGCSFPNPVVAVSLAPVILLPMTLFGGLFANLDSVGPWLSWIKYLSFFKWGYEGLLINEYTGMTLRCDAGEFSGVPPNQVCPITTGEQELAKLGLLFHDIYPSALILFGYALLYRILGLILLKYQTGRALNKTQ